MKRFDTDVAIVGGGMVGQTLALALASAGVEVAVLERAVPEATLAPSFDGRASAIAFATVQMLRGLDVWAELDTVAQPILDIRVSDGASPLFLHYDHRELAAGSPFGHMLENRHLRFALHHAMARAGVVIRAPVSVTSINTDAFGATATFDDGSTLRARLLVGTDGGKSFVRRAAGIRTHGWEYQHSGIVLTVQHEHHHGGVAHERFLPAGPFAILPLTGNRSSLVWTERHALAAAMVKLGDDRFAEEMRARFGDFLGHVEPTGPRWSYPLAMLKSERTVANRIALAGDAAQTLHPLAGQGLNLGMRDAAALAEVIVDAQRLGGDVGSGDVLERYARWRTLDALSLIAVTDGLNRLFLNEVPPVRIGRDVGLAVVNKIAPLKRAFVGHARGTAGKLPRLLLGGAL